MNGKRILCAALALCFLLAPLPAVSAAEIETYDLFVAGVQVTSENKDDLSVIDGVSGVAFFDPGSYTLTLKNADILAPGGDAPEQSAGVYGKINWDALTVEVYGTNTVSAASVGTSGIGMFAEGFNFRLHDGASLTVKGGELPDVYGESYGITFHYRPVVFEGDGSVRAVGGNTKSSSFGIVGSGKVVLNDGVSLTASGGAVPNSGASMGVNCNQLDVNGGSLRASAEGGEYCLRTCGINANSSNGFVINGGSVIASAGHATMYSNGIYSYGGLQINGGKVLAYTFAESGPAQALSDPAVLGTGVFFAGGSFNSDGSSLFVYDAGRNDEYKWFVAPKPAPEYRVEVEPGKNMTKADDSGDEEQKLPWYGDIVPVIYEADPGFCFPEDYAAVPSNGIQIRRESDTKIVVFGSPDADAALLLPDAVRSLFEDVSPEDWFCDAVVWAVERNITRGTSDTTFSPYDGCTRGQVATFLWRAAGSPEPAGTKNPFKDVKSDEYYYKAVLWAVEKGITSGTGKNTFSPNGLCTRGQIVTFLWRASGKPTSSGTSNPFKDVKPADYFYDAVLWAVGKGVTSGTSKTTFSPSETCTRGQVVTFLHRNSTK
ncbi:MAG: S-layer homology domain-containing protein [Clostridia bacterium]|nr:S-layer homology domain-containing protein [Clostridia bacterium]